MDKYEEIRETTIIAMKTTGEVLLRLSQDEGAPPWIEISALLFRSISVLLMPPVSEEKLFVLTSICMQLMEMENNEINAALATTTEDYQKWIDEG